MRKTLVYAMLMSTIYTYGQELTIPQLSQYLADNPFIMSPAYAGIGNYVKVRMNGLT